MARSFDDALSPMLHWGSSIFNPNNQDYSVSAWTKPTAGSNTGYVFGNFDTVLGMFLRRSGGGDNTKWTFGNDGVGIESGTGEVVEGVWQNIVVTHNAVAPSGIIYRDGSSVASAAMIDVSTSGQAFGVGNRLADLARGYHGGICEIAAWLNHILTVDQVGMLAEGLSPLFIRPLPTLYRALIRNDSGALSIGPATTTVGTVGVEEHPRIIYPRSRRHRPSLDAAGGAVLNLATPWVE